MDPITDLLTRVWEDVAGTLVADWPYLVASILAAAVLSVYVGTDRLAGWLRRRRWSAITGAVVLATVTPFCSCGTTAVVLGMMAAEAPWAPIVAFMVVSPLTSPSELLLSAGLFGWPFALLYFAGATAVGFAAGGIAGMVEDRGWLAGQARMAAGVRTRAAAAGSAAAGAAAAGSVASGCGGEAGVRTARDGGADDVLATRMRPTLAHRLRLRRLLDESWRLGRRVTGYFVAYTTVGYLLIELVPTSFLVDLLGADPLWGVPLAAVLGIPIYLTSEASLPMVAALMHGGMSAGPAMAFLVSGAVNSVGADRRPADCPPPGRRTRRGAALRRRRRPRLDRGDRPALTRDRSARRRCAHRTGAAVTGAGKPDGDHGAAG
jgi:uncharacterized membrane protein YraQ (UPF0718 family)